MTPTLLFRTGLLACVLLASLPPLAAQTFRERRHATREASRPSPSPGASTLPAGARALRDIAYGDDPRQRFDVYLPAQPHDAPILLFVHGGGWAHGSKDNPGVVENKAAYWLPKGYIFVSTHYRLRPDTAPLDQARDVARALAAVQKHAPEWHGDASRVLLMGHSAGAHLAALVGASSELWREAGATRPRGVVSLDGGALDVPLTMKNPPLRRIYDAAFGRNPADWIAASPYHRLTRDAVPMLFVCSSRRQDACPQGRAMVEKAKTLGVAMAVLPEDLSHGEVNRQLGLRSAYTDAVDAFVRRQLQ